jgi:hypothetical protein
VAQNAPTLSNINMSPVKSERKYVVSELSFFKPNENQKDVVASLEEWAARLLEPDISMILDKARKDKDRAIKIQAQGFLVQRSQLSFQSQNTTIKI